MTFKRATNIAGLMVLAITMVVYFYSAERTGSLWDCGEFILGAYKLQVVHPPGASLFLITARLFTWVASLLSDNPANIAFAVNLMSSLVAALAAMMMCWVTMILGKIAIVGRKNETDSGQNMGLLVSGLVGGLTTAFLSSLWFSAAEGEVYATSAFFNALTLWSAFKWYNLDDDHENDRWLVLSLFAMGVSTGVHLLSLLTAPAIAILYYLKNYEKRSLLGFGLAALAGVFVIWFIMKLVIVGIPVLWSKMELFTVNTIGLPIHSGLVPTVLIVGAIAYFALKYTHEKNYQLLQTIFFSFVLIVIASTTVMVVVIRANADTPVNMNTPTNVMRLIPYLNREQYGERPLLSGPHFLAQPINVTREDRFGYVASKKKYEKVDEKLDYVWNKRDNIFLPRIGHQDRPEVHNMWREALGYETNTTRNLSSYNFSYMMKYQIGWMYWRYFMWNFVGKQNADQGYFPWNKKDGHWISGITAIDEARLYNMDKLPDAIKQEESRNKYYFLPLLLGILGLIFHFSKSKEEFWVCIMLFLITGLGIIMYSNQPPNEPRERDYVLVGSFMTFACWVGLGALALIQFLTTKIKLGAMPAAGVGLVALAAPFLMATQNFDDHSRKDHTGARDFAANFLNSVDKNAIIFTYGDNDTYPLWYAQEVEGIRTDVRVVNLSLIAVDWYINKLRNKVNESPAIKLSIPAEGYMYKNLNQIMLPESNGAQMGALSIIDGLRAAAGGQVSSNGMITWPSANLYLPIDKQKIVSSGLFKDSIINIVDAIPLRAPNPKYLTKDDIAILDIISSNIYDRPVYFAVTCKDDKLMGLNDYMQLEGMALRIVPIKSQSDRSLGIYGFGRVANDKLFDNVMNKWKFGGFEKKKMFVDRSYLAAVQGMRLTMLRSAFAAFTANDTTKAVAITKKYFESFPNMNFRYDASISSFLDILVKSKAYTEAKKHIKILAQETNQHLEFYSSLDSDDLQSSFGQDQQYYMKCANDVIEHSREIGDAAFEQEMMKLVGKYIQPSPPPPAQEVKQ